ncbi:hypothetical protein C4577_07680 [Candidatus Parcubacteria bacterium]|nr:MAG: hypothetical protein C4577_07680 [Candidatus Parcubacteria bacterium]
MTEKIKFFISSKVIFFYLTILLIVPVLFPLIRPGFFPTQDTIHLPRLYQMDKAIKDGQFPVRWSPDFRYGEPIFNFYAPLPFYLGVLIHSLNISYYETTKILFGLSFLFAGTSMFFLGRKFFGNWGGVLSAVLYTYAPYHAVDVYVRGALSESFALIFFPLIFLSSFYLSCKPSYGNFLFLVFSLAGLFLTHNIMTVIFFPFFISWVIFILWQQKKINLIKYFVLAVIFSFGLAATFLLPAYFEKIFIRPDGLLGVYFDFRGHFLELKQLFFSNWGYGASVWGNEDGMSFSLGTIHLIIFVLSFSLLLLKRNTYKYLLFFLGFELLFSLFMLHNRSTPIWLTFPILAYVQFPWRFLGISIFFISFIGGFCGYYLKGKLKGFLVVIIAIIILANINFFKPDFYYDNFSDKDFTSRAVLSEDGRWPKDYVPVWVKKTEDAVKMDPQIIQGKASVSNFVKTTKKAEFNVKVIEKSEIEVPIAYFPGWEVMANGKHVKLDDLSENGLIKFTLSKGEYFIKLQFKDTIVRIIGNLTTVFFILLIIFCYLYQKKLTKNNEKK